MKAVLAPVVIRDLRSVRLEDLLRAKWRDDVRRKSPAEREAWLNSTEGIIALGSAQCHQLRKSIARDRCRAQRQLCSAALIEAWHRYGVERPVQPRERKHAVRLKLSRAETRYGDDGQPSRRWTPPQAVDEEDFIDSLSVMDAAWLSVDWVGSCSAHMIQKISMLRASPVDGNW